MTHPFRIFSTLLLLLTACTGIVGEGPLLPPDTGSPPETPQRFDPNDPPVGCDEVSSLLNPLRRLTRSELESTLRELVGDRSFSAVELAYESFPPDHVGAGETEGFSHLHTSTHADAVFATADTLSGAVLSDRTRAAASGYRCVTEASPDEECVRGFVTSFGRRVFRRPLAPEEVEDQVAYFLEHVDSREGLHRVTTRLLSSPQLLFHLETEGELTGESLRLDPYVVASRISFAVLGSMPTPELFEAAERGELGTVEEVERWVRTLLDDPRAAAHFSRFVESWLGLGEVGKPPSELLRRAGIRENNLGDAMMVELDTFARTLFFEGADFETLMTSRRAFAEDDRLAGIYNVAPWVPGTDAPMTGPERGGLLLRAALLVNATNTTAPILRGVKVRRQILCDVLPPPSSDVVNSRLDSVEDLSPSEHSSRDIIEDMTNDAACVGCHQAINPIAFAFEEFDQVGAYRTTEEVWEMDELAAEHPINAETEVVVDTDDAVPVNSAMDLVTAIAQSDRGHACFAQRLFEHVHLRAPRGSEACEVASVYETLREGGSMLDAYVATIARQTTLTRAVPEEL